MAWMSNPCALVLRDFFGSASITVLSRDSLCRARPSRATTAKDTMLLATVGLASVHAEVDQQHMGYKQHNCVAHADETLLN